MMKWICLTCLTVGFLSCTDSHEEPPLQSFDIERIDKMIYDYPNGIDIDSLEPGVNLYISMMGLDDISQDSALTLLNESRVTKVFGSDIIDRLDSTSGVSPVKVYGDSIAITHVYGIASPYNQQVIISDSIAFIALNHYLGADYEGYRGMPDYMRVLKNPDRIPFDLLEAVIRVNYPYSPTEETLLERMFYEGAIINELCRLTNSTPAKVLGIPEEQYTTFNNNLNIIWQTIAANNLLYSTDNKEIDRLIQPSPSVDFGQIQLPGKTGRLVGYKIIQSYIKNNNADRFKLLSPQFYSTAQKRLLEAKFRP